MVRRQMLVGRNQTSYSLILNINRLKSGGLQSDNGSQMLVASS